eukprot:1695804-Alexandrium_andersonii.AAC.1
MAKPSLLEAFVRGSPWPSSGQWGLARAASARRTCGGPEFARAGGPAACAYVFSPERRWLAPLN